MRISSLVFAAIAAASLAATAQALPTRPVVPTIYYGDQDLRTINRLRLDGSPPQLLTATDRAFAGLNVVGQTLYWVNGGPGGREGGKITRANLDGSNQQVIYAATGANESVNAIAFDDARAEVFWLDQLGGRLMRMPLAGGAPTVVLTTVGNRQFGGALEVDPVRGHAYFTSGGTGEGVGTLIERVDFDGSDRQTIAQAYGHGISLDLVREQIFTADWFRHKIQRVGFDGSGLTTIVSTASPRDVQVVGDKLYYPNIISVAPNGTGPFFYRWARSDLNGANQEVLWSAPRAEGPQDMISFAVVIPEPSTAGLAILGFALLNRRRK